MHGSEGSGMEATPFPIPNTPASEYSCHPIGNPLNKEVGNRDITESG